MNKSQLNELLSSSDEMTKNLQNLKNAVLNNNASEHFGKLSDCLIQAISSRKIFRNLALSLDTNRNLVQLNKQKIERSRVFLEGLEYYKATLKEKIQDFQIQVENIDDYFDQPFGEVDWEEKYEVSEQKLKKSYQAIKQKTNFLQERTNKKLKLKAELETLRKSHRQVIPSQTKKLKDQVVDIGKVMNIEQVELFQDIKNLNLLRVYDILKTLKEKECIEICYENDQYQCIELWIRKRYLNSYDQAFKNKIYLEEKDVKITISSLSPHYNQLVVGVDRRADFTNFQLFNRLINEEEVKDLFNPPENEQQRNLNNKYISLDWLENILCSSVSDVIEFIKRIRQRMFCIQMNKFLFETMKKMNFYQPLGVSKESPGAFLSMKKLSFGEISSIGFEQYLKKVPIPKIVYKCMTDYKRLNSGILNKSQQEDMTCIPKKKQNIENYFRKLHLEDMLTPRLNNYYNIVLVYDQIVYDVIVIVPYAYPKKQSMIKFMNISNKEQKEVEMIEGLPCKYLGSGKSTHNDKIQHLEWCLNEKIHEFPEIHKNEDFFLVFQLNRMFTLIAGLRMKVEKEAKQKHA